MEYAQVLDQARAVMAPRCKVCPECNGIACRNIWPGPGGQGTARTFLRNYTYLHDQVKIQMDVLSQECQRDTQISLFGQTFSAPIFCAPIGLVSLNYSDALDEDTYAQAVVEGTRAAGTAAFTGGGPVDKCFYMPLEVIRANGGWGIPTLKPWEMSLAKERIRLAEDSGAFALAMDIDTAGLAHAKAAKTNRVVLKDEADLAQLAFFAKVPFIVKGIMTPASAVKAAKAGVYGIVVSNHGGRVLDGGLSTAEVLPSIRAAVGGSVKLFVDGGIRSGADVFKMLALGADAVLIGRPYAVAAYGGGAEGVQLYTERLIGELRDTMMMTSCANLAEITRDKIAIV